jgi:hypothetical protein
MAFFYSNRHWKYITLISGKCNNDHLPHLLKIALDINKCDYKGNTLLYIILNRPSWIFVDNFKSLMEHLENVKGTKWISLLETRRGLFIQHSDLFKYVSISNKW